VFSFRKNIANTYNVIAMLSSTNNFVFVCLACSPKCY